MMPGGSAEAYKDIKDIVEKVSAQVGGCVFFTLMCGGVRCLPAPIKDKYYHTLS